jgi:LysR family transcriptional regulator for bpeEF and oprC
MDRLVAMRIFARVVEAGSFVKAADSLQLSVANVSRSVQALETHLGARLLNRTTRNISITEDGEMYYQRCVNVLAEVEDMEAELTHVKHNPKGKLKVNLPALVARTTVIPALPEFFAMYPDIEIEMGLSDRQVDIVEEGVDCVIRVGELEDSGLVAKCIGKLDRVTCASPSYLAKYGEPHTLEDLRHHIGVNYVSANTGRVRGWEFIVDGKTEVLDMKGVIAVNDADAYVQCGLHGLGILKGTRYTLAAYLKSGALQEILKDYPSPVGPISILFSPNRHLPRKIRVFVDWVVEVFAREPLMQCEEGRAALERLAE